MAVLSVPSVAPGLASGKSTFRLNQIDKVRANGVGDQVSLPQLVVCGDQSAGKSSVLERVTGIPFPRQEGLCTRFPTEIILRHTAEPLSISASILPSSQHGEEVEKALRGYKRHLSDMSELPEVISETATLLGLRGSGPEAKEDANSFAHDVLRIELVGTVGLHLTIVDLPGLISVPDDGQTDVDVQIVRDLIEKYLSSRRTIIMAVVQAGNDIANQGIIRMAKRHDPEGQRTVGIITKPDLINEGAEPKIAMLAKNQDSVKLKLGYFLMKNPSPKEIEQDLSWDSLLQLEREFFCKPVWQEHDLHMSRVGAQALRTFLQALLDKHIERELPQVREEIKKLLAKREKELSSMGLERPTPGHIRQHLTEISMRFHSLSEAALNGNYQGPGLDFFKPSGTRLRADVHKVNGEFAERMRVHGEKRRVKPQSSGEDTDDESIKGGEEEQLVVSKRQMTAWVKEVYMNTRGRELPGNYNFVLLEELFHEQSSLWPALAKHHLRTIFKMAIDWVGRAVKATAKEDDVGHEVLTICHRGLEEAERLAENTLDILISEEKGHLITYNHYYTDNIQKARLSEQRAAIEKAVSRVEEEKGMIHVINTTSEIQQFVHDLQKNIVVDMDTQACSEAMDGLEAYYKVAMKTFIDNVCRQVVERHILSALPGLFCPATVSAFSDAELLRIGSEPDSLKQRRSELQAKVKGLRQSLVDLQVASF